MKQITTLAIDTSCDETSCAVVQGTTVLSNVLPSQIEFHRKYGGVVPSIARLAHQERIDGVVTEALKKAKLTMKDIDLIAVTKGPGLAIALEVGIKKAKELAAEYKKPLMTINHMEGHLLSTFAERKVQKNFLSGERIKESDKHKIPSPSPLPSQSNRLRKGEESSGEVFPAIGVLVSGKHTELVLIRGIGEYEIIGETLDDACGEAFDKCGRILGLGYPAGPTIAKFAKENRKKYAVEFKKKDQSLLAVLNNTQPHPPLSTMERVLTLPIAMANSKDLNFSYSGLKTAFRSLVTKLSGEDISIEDELANELPNLSKDQIFQLCILFEEAAFKPIELKLAKAIEKYYPKEIWLGGGVASNSRLRSIIRSLCRKNKINFRFPNTGKLNTDNAAMIGVAANMRIASSLQQTAGSKKTNSPLSRNLRDSSPLNKRGKADVYQARGVLENLKDLPIYFDNFDSIDREPSLRF